MKTSELKLMLGGGVERRLGRLVPPRRVHTDPHRPPHPTPAPGPRTHARRREGPGEQRGSLRPALQHPATREGARLRGGGPRHKGRAPEGGRGLGWVPLSGVLGAHGLPGAGAPFGPCQADSGPSFGPNKDKKRVAPHSLQSPALPGS